MTLTLSVHLIWGPTSTGKTGASIALAQATGRPVLALDRIQCCEALSMGSGRPLPEELQGTRRDYLCERPLSAGMVSSEEAHVLLKSAVSRHRQDGQALILEGGSVSLINEMMQDDYWQDGISWRLLRYRLDSASTFLARARVRVRQMFEPPPGHPSLIDELLAGLADPRHRDTLADVDGYRAALLFAEDHRLGVTDLRQLPTALRDELIDQIANEYLMHARWQEDNFLPVPPGWQCEEQVERVPQ